MVKAAKLSIFDCLVLIMAGGVIFFFIRDNGFNWAVIVFMLANYLVGVICGAKVESNRMKKED